MDAIVNEIFNDSFKENIKAAIDKAIADIDKAIAGKPIKVINNANFKYINRILSLAYTFNCEVFDFDNGVLGYGKIIIQSPGNTCIVIQEKYLNTNSSTHTITYYKTTPETIQNEIDNF